MHFNEAPMKPSTILTKPSSLVRHEIHDGIFIVEYTNVMGYWMRHQLHLLRNDVPAATHDLDRIIDLNRSHYGALLAKARLLRYNGM